VKIAHLPHAPAHTRTLLSRLDLENDGYNLGRDGLRTTLVLSLVIEQSLPRAIEKGTPMFDEPPSSLKIGAAQCLHSSNRFTIRQLRSSMPLCKLSLGRAPHRILSSGPGKLRPRNSRHQPIHASEDQLARLPRAEPCRKPIGGVGNRLMQYHQWDG